MSIYTPPNKLQSIFNPRNFGSLGQGGEINREYLNATFLLSLWHKEQSL